MCRKYFAAGKKPNPLLNWPIFPSTGRISKYFHFSCSMAACRYRIRKFTFSLESQRGSQWSENGSDTRRRPVNQLLTRQNTRPFFSSPFGGEVVKTTGSYP